MKPCSEHANVIRRLDLITMLLVFGLVGGSGLATILQGWMGSPLWMEVLESMLAPILILVVVWLAWLIYFRFIIKDTRPKKCGGCKK